MARKTITTTTKTQAPISRIYALEADGAKFLIWGADGRWEVTLDQQACRFHCRRGDEVDVYVYPAPGKGSVIIYDNGGDQREYEFVNAMLIPRSNPSEPKRTQANR